jgi:hypothetical protein
MNDLSSLHNPLLDVGMIRTPRPSAAQVQVSGPGLSASGFTTIAAHTARGSHRSPGDKWGANRAVAPCFSIT